MENDFMVDFEFDSKNEWKVLRRSLLFHFATILGFVYFFISKEYIGLYIGFGFLVVIMPQMILHFQYKLNDRNKKITVNHSKQTVRIERNGKFEKEFQFIDINKILRHKGQKDENNMTYALPTFFYNYTEIILNNGQRIFFTDFLTKTIGLKDIETKEKLSVFNLIY